MPPSAQGPVAVRYLGSVCSAWQKGKTSPFTFTELKLL
jgi:hypothetical protein